MSDRHDSPDAPALATLARVGSSLDAFCEAEQLPPDVAWRLRVAVDELVANIVTHGAAGGRTPSVEITFRRTADGVEFTLADDGPAFDPLALPTPDVTLPMEARQPGGLGIALVRALLDDLRYRRTDRNVLTASKRLAP